MTSCPYCGARTGPEEHRCQQCKGRLEARAFAAAAPALRLPAETPAPPPPARPEPVAQPRLVAYQQPLFVPREFPRAAPAGRSSAGARAVAARQASRLAGQTGQRQYGLFRQETLAARAPGLVVICHARPASLGERLTAFSLDVLLALSGVAVFFGLFHLAAGQEALAPRMLPVYGALLVATGGFFDLVYAVTGMDSLGMRWRGLCLLDFDGRQPEPRQRLHRLAASLLSVLAAGLGILWALADEEKLTWHDHVSKTFPTRGDRL